jgi:acyl-CoA thioester hydrolase
MKTFRLDFEVRDNEIDMQGIVNNANYFIYFAHARHKFLKELGVSFAKMTEENQLLLLISSTIEYKRPLKSEDLFYVTCQLAPEGKIRFAFEQEIRKTVDDSLIATARNIGVCLNGNHKNRPYVPEIIKSSFI